MTIHLGLTYITITGIYAATVGLSCSTSKAEFERGRKEGIAEVCQRIEGILSNKAVVDQNAKLGEAPNKEYTRGYTTVIEGLATQVRGICNNY